MNSENCRVKHHSLVHFDHVTFTKVAHNLIDHGIPSRILICRSQYLPNGARRSLDHDLGSDGAIFMTCDDCANSREGNYGYDDRYAFYLFHGSLLIESGARPSRAAWPSLIHHIQESVRQGQGALPIEI